MRPRRRAFLKRLGQLGALVATGLPWTALAEPTRRLGRRLRTIPAYFADLDRDGAVGANDIRLVQRAIATRRGFAIDPRPGYDHRADLFARGRVGERDLAAVRSMRDAEAGEIRRPVTVAWHYGWYHKPRRKQATVGFLGGDYVSADARTERQFNNLKNEFGVTVDALSYIAPRIEPRVLRNYLRGYAQARNARSRHVALLYESGISLGAPDQRIDFGPAETRNRMIDDFDHMGAFLRELVDSSGSRPFEIAGRPVMFIYASHTWVVDPSSDAEFMAVQDTLDHATAQFATRYGATPFLIGEEMLLAPDDEFSRDRARRSSNFDGMFVYHHASSPRSFEPGEMLGATYAHRQIELLRRNLKATSELRNRFTDEPLLVVPSLAAGFAKHAHPRLVASRSGYVDYLRAMDAAVREEYFADDAIDALPPSFVSTPVYTVGSWNEEFEGHALLPARVNGSLKRVRHSGFDLVLALKEVFGWNRYSGQSLDI